MLAKMGNNDETLDRNLSLLFLDCRFDCKCCFREGNFSTRSVESVQEASSLHCQTVIQPVLLQKLKGTPIFELLCRILLSF